MLSAFTSKIDHPHLTRIIADKNESIYPYQKNYYSEVSVRWVKGEIYSPCQATAMPVGYRKSTRLGDCSI